MPLISCHLSIITIDVLSECCTTCNCRCTNTNTACVITTNEAFPLIYRSSRLKKCEEARSPSLYVVWTCCNAEFAGHFVVIVILLGTGCMFTCCTYSNARCACCTCYMNTGDSYLLEDIVIMNIVIIQFYWIQIKFEMNSCFHWFEFGLAVGQTSLVPNYLNSIKATAQEIYTL